MLEQAAELRRILVTAMIYPIALLIIAVSVVALMLLHVVPQFEHLLDSARVQLPTATMESDRCQSIAAPGRPGGHALKVSVMASGMDGSAPFLGATARVRLVLDAVSLPGRRRLP